MAKQRKRLLIAIGQSQTIEVGDAQSWEDLHPELAIRSPTTPATRIPQFSEGSASDAIVMPMDFPGGLRTGRFGDGYITKPWQTANCRGRAVQAFRYLTFYNPVASRLNVGLESTTTYPGTGAVLPGSTTESLVTTVRWQYDPVGLKIRRQRTGVEHTIQAGWTTVTNTVTVSPPMVPPPEIGEQFDYEIAGGANSADTSSLLLTAQFGGLHDIGSQLDQVPPLGTAALPAQHTAMLRIAGLGTLTGRVLVRSRPVYVGQPVAFTTTGPATQTTDPSHPAIVSGTTYYVAEVDKAPASQTVFYTLGPSEVNVFGATHGLVNGEVVRFTGSPPTGLALNTDYYVIVTGAAKFQVSATSGGTAISFTGGGTGSVESQDAYASFSISRTPGGTPLKFITTESSGFTFCTVQEAFRASMSGIVVRCTSGANAGQERICSDLDFTTLPVTRLTVSVPWGSTPQAGDRYEFSPPTMNGEAVAWDEWAMFLPWSPFEGSALPSLPYPVQLSTDPANGNIVGSNVAPLVGTPVRFYTSGTLPSPLVPGQTYYIQKSVGDAFYVSTTYRGSALLATGTPGSGAAVIVVEYVQSAGHQNPFPPGFNYPNHECLPRQYQPYDGAGSINRATMSHHVALANLMHDFHGEQIDVVVCGVGGTSLAHKETVPVETATGFGWFGPRHQLSWAPSEPDGCFARFLTVLKSAKRAYDLEGVEVSDVLVVYTQGEEDARFEHFAANYETNATMLRQKVREAIVEAGLYTGDPKRIKWIHPRMAYRIWEFITEVNTAVTNYIRRDPYSGTFSTDDVEVGFDGLHYSGAGQSLLADRVFEVYKKLLKVGAEDVTVCNLALSNLGDAARVTSISPPDGSTQSVLCSQYFDIALTSILEQHPWDFALRRVDLVAREVETGRADWQYAYEYPEDAILILDVLATDTTNDVVLAGQRVGQPFNVEVTQDGERVIYTNVANAAVRYTSKVIDSSRWTSAFKTALSWKLAAMLAGPIVKGEEGAKIATNALRMAELFIPRAKSIDAMHMRRPPTTDDPPRASWHKGR